MAKTIILNVGLPKTGTTSLCAALNILGIRAQHDRSFLLGPSGCGQSRNASKGLDSTACAIWAGVRPMKKRSVHAISGCLLRACRRAPPAGVDVGPVEGACGARVEDVEEAGVEPGVAVASREDELGPAPLRDPRQGGVPL